MEEKKPALTWSRYSLDIFRAVRSKDPSNHHIVVNAVAGSGKTTNAVEIANIIEEDRLGTYGFYAFNQEIVKTLKSRLSDPNAARTLNSLGLNMLAMHLGFWPQLNQGKYYDLIKSSLENMGIPSDKMRETVNSVKDVLSKAMANLVYANSPTFDSDLLTVVEDYGIDMPSVMQQEDVFNLVKDVLIRGEKMLRVKTQAFRSKNGPRLVESGMTYDDQIYFPNAWNLRCPLRSSNAKAVIATDFAVGDEIQDMSTAKFQLCLRSLKPNGRFVGFGDARQAIYFFAGADSTSIPNIVQQLNARELPLSISYRCPQAVIREAQKIVSHIESAPTAPEGVVRTITDENLVSELVPGSLVLSRKTNPLIKLCIQLLKNKVAAKVKGRDIGATLVKLAKDILKKKTSFANFRTDADNYLAERVLVMEEWKDKESRMEVLRDNIEAITAIVETFNPANFAALEASMDSLFSDGASVITLSTIHRAKGLEYQEVFIIRPEHLPLTWKNQKPAERLQEDNLKYVAITRAQERLTWVTTTKQEGEE